MWQQPENLSKLKNRPPENPFNLLQKYFPDIQKKTVVFGILNITPDSFSDGGKFLQPEKALSQAKELINDGADALDVGAESTRPGALAISSNKEWLRLQPVLEEILNGFSKGNLRRTVLSVDTRNSIVAYKALSLGVDLINDVSGGFYDPEMLPLIAEKGCPYILMHMRGNPQNMKEQCDYGKFFIKTLRQEILQRLEKSFANGVNPLQIIVDPGIGFAKTAFQSMEILLQLSQIRSLGYPLLIGPSRKSFLGLLHPKGLPSKFSQESLDLHTLAALTCGILNGAEMVRIHNVGGLFSSIRWVDRMREHERSKPINS